MPEDVKKMLESYAPEAVKFQYEVMTNKNEPTPIRVKCSELLADRGLGRPVQSLNVEGSGVMMIVIKDDMEGV